MKVAQNDQTNPDTQPVRPPHIPSIANTQLSPSGSSVRKYAWSIIISMSILNFSPPVHLRKRETPGVLSRMFPPFVSITYYRVRAYLAPRIAMLCFVMLCLLRIYYFFPPLLSGRLRDWHRCWCPDRLRCWRPLLARAIRQASPWSPDIAYSFSLLLALE